MPSSGKLTVENDRDVIRCIEEDVRKCYVQVIFWPQFMLRAHPSPRPPGSPHFSFLAHPPFPTPWSLKDRYSVRGCGVCARPEERPR